MSRQSMPLLVWREDEEGETAGPYTVRLEAPVVGSLAKGRVCRLPPDQDRRPTSGNRLALTTWPPAPAGWRSRGCRRLSGRLGAALVGRTEPNPEYPPARGVADRFDQARSAVEAGRVVIDQVGRLFDGIEGGSFEHGGRLKLGLTGVFDGDCYAMTWRSGYRWVELRSGVIM